MGLERHISFQHWKCLINHIDFQCDGWSRQKLESIGNWTAGQKSPGRLNDSSAGHHPQAFEYFQSSLCFVLIIPDTDMAHNDHIHICPPVFRGIMPRHTGSTWIEMHPHVKLTLKVFLSEKLQTFPRIGRGWWAGACMNNMGHIFWDIIYQKWQSHSDTVPVVRHKGASVQVGMYLVNARDNHKIREQLNNSDVKH